MPKRSGKNLSGVVEALASENLPHLKAMGRRERRAAETRVRLFRCALQLFAQHGFPNVTVEDITEAADVGKGTFFNYFESKDDVLGVMAEIQLGKLRYALSQAEAGKRPIRLVLRQLIRDVADEPGRTPELARALVASFLASVRVRHAMGQNMATGRGILAQILRIAQQAGEIDPDLDPAELALMVQQSFFGTLLIWSLGGKRSLRTALDRTYQHFWRAVCPPSKEQMR